MALAQHARKQKTQFLYSRIDQLKDEKAALDAELTQTFDELQTTKQKLVQQIKRSGYLVEQTGRTLDHLTKHFFLGDSFREWRRIASMNVSKRFKEADRLRALAERDRNEAETKRDLWEARMNEAVGTMQAQRRRIEELEAEKTTIAEHFSEALKIAQGGKCLPALPSAFLCRNCQGELVGGKRAERDEEMLDLLAKQGSPRAEMGKINLSAVALAGVGKRRWSRSPSPSPRRQLTTVVSPKRGAGLATRGAGLLQGAGGRGGAFSSGRDDHSGLLADSGSVVLEVSGKASGGEILKGQDAEAGSSLEQEHAAQKSVSVDEDARKDAAD